MKNRLASDKAALQRIKSFQPQSFDRVLLDAPCSALGLRPRLFAGEVLLLLVPFFLCRRLMCLEYLHLGCLNGHWNRAKKSNNSMLVLFRDTSVHFKFACSLLHLFYHVCMIVLWAYDVAKYTIIINTTIAINKYTVITILWSASLTRPSHSPS